MRLVFGFLVCRDLFLVLVLLLFMFFHLSGKYVTLKHADYIFVKMIEAAFGRHFSAMLEIF